MPRALMIQGTASHVGKSVLTAAFGRWLRDQMKSFAIGRESLLVLSAHEKPAAVELDHTLGRACDGAQPLG